MNELQIFNNPEFGEIRTVRVDGKPYFVGIDIAKALGYKNPNDAITRHCKGCVKHAVPTKSGVQQMNVIPKGDIYRLAANSELPGAEKFESWIFDEVLVSVNEHGAYLTSAKIEEVLLNPDTIIRLATALKEERHQKELLAAEIENKNQIIGELQPKADYVDYILSSIGVMATTQIAADYGLTPNKLNKILHEENIQHKVGGQWILYKEHMGMGYTKSETIPINRSDGRPDTKLFTKWTQKGRLMINEILNKNGIYANMDIVENKYQK